MHIEKYNNNGIDYLRLVEGKRMRAPAMVPFGCIA